MLDYANILNQLDWFASDPNRRPILRDFLRDTGIPERSLRHICQRMLGISPKAYVTQRRLILAHEMLQASDPETVTVTFVAQLWSFDQLGRFSVIYRQRFGCTPSQTLRG